MTARRLLAATVILVFGIGAVAFSASRDGSYRAWAKLTPVQRGALEPSISPRYVRAVLRAGDEELRVRLARSGTEPALLDSVRVGRSRQRGSVRVSVAAGTPARARRLLRDVVRQLDARSARELTRFARRALRRTESRLADPLLTPEDRLEREVRAGLIRRFLRAPRARFGSTRPRIEKPARWADRAVGDLPGPFPQRPSPVWAGVAGLLAGALIVAVLALLKGRPRSLDRLA